MLAETTRSQSAERDTDKVRCESWRNELRVIFPSTPLAVRDALHSTLVGLRHLRLEDDAASTVELVLAEVANNIVEHAYPDGATGMIELHIAHDPDGLSCTTLDDGLPMPGGMVPVTQPPSPDVPLEDAAEGGFGWLLIRELSQDLAYSRDGDRNRLSFRLDVARTIQSC